jgi:hypothetical protein
MAFNLLREVNKVLELLSLPMVDDTTINTDRDAQMVVRKLDEVRLELEANGWGWNSSETVLEPDINGEIHLDGVLSFRDRLRRDKYYRNIDNKLFDTRSKSFKFDSGVKLIIIEDLPLDQAPPYFIELVTAQTAWELRATLGGNIQDTLSSLQDNWIRKKANAIQRNIDEQGLNYLGDKRYSDYSWRSFWGIDR